jgi:hypothetical protein
MTTTNENYVYAEDDKGVACRFTEEKGWEPLEPSCLSCGVRSEECNCGNYILADYIDEDKGDDEDSDDDDDDDDDDFTYEELEKLKKQFPREMLDKLFDNLLKI